MELFDDWTSPKALALRPQGAKSRTALSATAADAVRASLADFDPPILNVHCYIDANYRWVQVVFEETIRPAEVIRLGERLEAAAGEDGVYFNSLRPRAAFFVLEPALDSKVDMRASQYGTRLAELESAWNLPAATTAARAGKAARRGTSRGVAARRGR
jgi:hypothetical protein